MKYLYFVIILFPFLISCQPSFQNEGLKEINLGVFSLKVPASWIYIEQQGIDSFIGAFKTSTNDTITFDYGVYSNNLSDDGRKKIVATKSLLPELLKEGRDTSRFVFVDREEDVLPMRDKLVTQVFENSIINNRKAKIVKAKRTGKGITGVYFHNLKVGDMNDTVSFSMYGSNLQKESEEEMLKVIKTLEFN